MSELKLEKVESWSPHPSATPLTEQNGETLAVAANGTRTCIGGWQLTYSGAVAGKTYSIRATTKYESIEQVYDVLRCEAYWGEMPANLGQRRSDQVLRWDFLIPEAIEDDTIRFGRCLTAPEGTDKLTLRYTFRWTTQGSSDWQFPEIEVTESPDNTDEPVRISVVTGQKADRHSMKSIQDNVDFYLPLCEKVCETEQPDLVVLPEIALQWQIKGSPLDRAVPAPGIEMQPFADLAKKYRVHVLLGLIERDGDAVHNTGALIGPDGEIVGKYRKVHLAVGGEMETGILPGDDFPVFDTEIGRIGCNICMDSSAAESSRMVGLNGADFLLLPIMGDHRAWHPEDHTWDPERFRGIMQTRALDNQLCMVVAVNRAEGSCIIDRTGHVLAWNEGDQDYVTATVMLEDGFRPSNRGCYRSTNWMQRRPHAYGAFVEEGNLGGLTAQEY